MRTFELWVVVKGSTPITVQQLPMIRISMSLQMDVKQFLEADTSVFTTGLAHALGIPASTIRVTVLLLSLSLLRCTVSAICFLYQILVVCYAGLLRHGCSAPSIPLTLPALQF
jgi:hypothetical protein